MHDTFTFNGKKYVTATTAGKHFGYSKEYVLMLIKKGKFEGQKIKHKWFVDIDSAEEYFAHAERDREEQLKKLSEVRKQELQARSIDVQQVASRPVVSRMSKHAQVALFETVMIVVLGVSLGSFGYLGTSTSTAAVYASEYGFFKGLAVSVYDFFNDFTLSSQDEILHATHPQEEVHVARAGTYPTSSPAFAVSSDELFTLTTTSVAAIAESFSDDVSVALDAERANTAVITPQFRDGAGEENRFLMVPVVNTPNE